MEQKTVDAGLLQSRYRLTKQRSAVLRALSDGKHLSAETILDRVRTDMAGVSLGTIYRTLDILREIGLVQIVAVGGHAARYEAALEKHHHLLCTSCKELTNVRAPELEELVLAVSSREAFAKSDHSLVIYGRCADCVARTAH